jgi:predicted sulfurtransferase
MMTAVTVVYVVWRKSQKPPVNITDIIIDTRNDYEYRLR